MKNSITTKKEVLKKYFTGFKTFQFILALFIAGLGVLGQHALQAQNSMVFIHPSQSDGYLVWQNGGDSVRYWKVEIKERVSGSNGTYTDKVVWKHEEWRQNFVFIPEEFRPKNIINRFGIFLNGYNSNNTITVEEDIVPFIPDQPQTYFIEACYYTCNGPKYAWTVQQLIPSDGGGYKCQLMGASYLNGEAEHVPYYEFMTNTSFQTLISNQNYAASFYGLPSYVIMEGSDWQNYHVKTITNSSDIEYRDWQGDLIPHQSEYTLKAVRKSKGPWNQVNYSDSFTSMLSDPSDFCVNSTSWQYVGSLMDSYANFNPDLVCQPQQYPDASGTAWGGDLSECFYLFEPGECCDVGTLMQNWLNCIGSIDSPGDGGIDGSTNLPWANINTFELANLTQGGFEALIKKNAEDLFDATGNFIPFSIDIPAGLYYMSATIKQSSQIIPEKVFELKEPTNLNFTLANMFDFTVFPVPHVEDHFTINMQASANL
jgi:hypothetical protein